MLIKMRLFLASLVIVVFICCSYFTAAMEEIEECGISDVVSSSNAGYTSAEECEFPWMVSVEIPGQFCAGFIVDERAIITAAECVLDRTTNKNVDPSEVTVRAGSSKLASTAEYKVMYVYAVTETRQYSLYSSVVAVLVLEERLSFSPCLRPICLPREQRSLSTFPCTFVTWSSSDDPVELKKVSLTLPRFSYCQTSHAEYSQEIPCSGNLSVGVEERDSRGSVFCQVNKHSVAFGLVTSSIQNRAEISSLSLFMVSEKRIMRFIDEHIDLCGISEVASRRIIGGTNAEECEFPWMVGIADTVSCNGVILNETTILTIASCVCWLVKKGEKCNTTDMYVLYGSSFGNRMQHILIQDIFPDRNYDSYHGIFTGYDIAIVTLKGKMKFSKCVRPICLPKPGQEPPAFGIVASWGYIAADIEDKLYSERMNHLQKITVSITSNTTCHLMEENLTTTERQMCIYNKGKMHLYYGDGGAPLMSKVNNRYVLFGLVHYMEFNKTADNEYPGIYIKVFHPTTRASIDDLRSMSHQERNTTDVG